MSDPFAEALAGHRAELLRHCYRMLGSFQDAEEAVQEALLNAWKGARRAIRVRLRFATGSFTDHDARLSERKEGQASASSRDSTSSRCSVRTLS